MQQVQVKDAVGMVLCHDITKIVPGEFKGRVFKKGYIIREGDIPELLKIGKENIYVWKSRDGYLHEDEAAQRIARAVQGKGLDLTEPKEGKVNLVATHDGLLKINAGQLSRLNSIDQVVVATLHGNRVVRKGTVVAGTKVIPLIVEARKVKRVEAICAGSGGIVEVLPLRQVKAGLIITGNEVYKGRIEDKFGPVLKEKLAFYGSKVLSQVLVPDNAAVIANAVKDMKALGAELILVSGGMSVDPDDVTPSGVRAAGGEIVLYGAPVLPGSMFMLAYLNGTPVLGLPGCVMFNKTTIFDLVLPRLLAGENIARRDVTAMGYGGLCANCPVCSYPHCPFGKGI